AGRFASAVSVTAGGHTADAKSVLGVMGLGATSGQQVTVAAAGPDAREAVAALIALLSEATKVGGLTDGVWVYGYRLMGGWVTWHLLAPAARVARRREDRRARGARCQDRRALPDPRRAAAVDGGPGLQPLSPAAHGQPADLRPQRGIIPGRRRAA